jgi:hypothetical protein
MAAKPSTTLKSHPTSSAPKNPDSAAAAASTSSGRKPHDNYQLPRTGYSPAAVIISQLTEQNHSSKISLKTTGAVHLGSATPLRRHSTKNSDELGNEINDSKPISRPTLMSEVTSV